MTRIVKVADILLDIYTDIANERYDITIDDNLVFTSQQFFDFISLEHYDKSYVSHLDKASDYTVFKKLWANYVAKNSGEWAVLYAAATADIDPTADYAEHKVYKPNTTISGSVVHGLVQTNSGTLVNQYANGRTVTNSVNTFDGTLRNESSTVNSGTDTNTATDTRAVTNSGTDTTSSTTTGTNTEDVTGYRHNPVENMEKYIALQIKSNLTEIIVNGFTGQYLFYDNDNYREGCIL